MIDYIIGTHSIEEKLKNPVKGSILCVQRTKEKRFKELIQKAKINGVMVKKMSDTSFEALPYALESKGCIYKTMGFGTKDGVETKKYDNVAQFCKNLEDDKSYTVLVLDGVTDVHNLGAILRSCDQFNVDLVVIPQRRSASVDSTAIRISSGAALYLSVANVVNLNRELEILKDNGFWIYGADMKGESLPKTSFAKRSVIVMGSEGKGLSKIVRDNVDHMVSIPTNGHIDSLNVSVACAIILYQRHVTKA